MDATHLRIIIGDDEPAAAEAIRRAFEAADIAVEIETAGTLAAYQVAVAARPPDIALVHLNLPGGGAIGALTAPPEAGPCPVLVMTSTGNEQTAVEVMKAGALDYVVESAEAFVAMPHTVARALREWKLLHERKRAEEALRESETRFRLLTELISDYAYELRIRPDGTPRGEWLTESFTSMFGYSLEENQARGGLFSIVLPEDLPIATEHFQRVAAGKADVTEMRFVTRGGETRWLRDYARPVWDDARQKVTRIFGAAQDITERKRVEEAMTTERSLLRTLVDNLPDSVYVKDLAGRKTLANPADIRKMGVASAAEALGKTDFEVFPPDLAAIFDADDQHVIQTGQPVLNREERFILPDGSQGWQLTSKAPLRDRAGQVIGLVGIGHDITERKRAEEALRESEARFRVIFERANDAIHVDNADDQILQVNPRMGELTGYSREELLTMRVSDLQAPEVRGQSGNVVRNELARHGHVAFESLNLHR
ncbi:MAG: PAS domain S-box protein, partial [Anaerolineae bacterium]